MTAEDRLIVLLFKIVLLGDVVSILAFIVAYSALAPWWINRVGRSIVVKDFLLVAALSVSILSLFFHFNRLTSHIAAWVDLGLFLVIIPVMLQRSWLFAKIARVRRAELVPPDDVGLPGGRHLTRQEALDAAHLLIGDITQLGDRVTATEASLAGIESALRELAQRPASRRRVPKDAGPA